MHGLFRRLTEVGNGQVGPRVSYAGGVVPDGQLIQGLH